MLNEFIHQITFIFSREKQEARDHMIGYLGSLQKRAEADYDTQIYRAQAQREAKELREEQEKLDKQRKMQEAINQHRHETVGKSFFRLEIKLIFQMKRHETEKEMEEREDIEMRQKKAETDRLFLLYQQEKENKRDEAAQALSEFHLKQAVSYSKKTAITFFFFNFIASSKRS